MVDGSKLSLAEASSSGWTGTLDIAKSGRRKESLDGEGMVD